MRADLRSWLENGARPADFYELLGVPRFTRDREALLAAGQAGYAALQGYQNAGESIRRQAHTLQLQFARAVQTFSSDDAWRAYDEQLRRGAQSVPVAPAAAKPAAEGTVRSPAPRPARSRLDPRGVRLMLMVAAVTATVLLLIGGLAILVLRFIRR